MIKTFFNDISMRGIYGLGLVLLLVVAGCSSKVTSSTTTKVSDSVSVKVVPRYVTITVPGDTVTVREYIKCDSITNLPLPFIAEAKGTSAKVRIALNKTGKLVVTGGCDEYDKKIQVLDSLIAHYRNESTKTQETKIEYKTRKIDIFCRWFTGISLLLIIVFFLIKLNLIRI